MTDQLHLVRLDATRHAPASHRVRPSHEAHNGLGRAALVLSVIGVLTGAIAFLFPIAFVCGVLGTLMAIGAVRRVRSGVANNGRTAGVALAVGLLAILLSVVGFVAAVVASEELSPSPETATATVVLR